MSAFLCRLDAQWGKFISASVEPLSFAPEARAQVHCEGPFSVVCTRVDSLDLFGSAVHPDTGVRVYVGGRVALEEEEWQAAEEDQTCQGGLAAKSILGKYLRQGLAALEGFNGAAAILLWDPRSKKVALATDRMGFFPVYGYRVEDVSVAGFCTDPDVLADAPGVSVDLDWTSLAQALVEPYFVHPYSFYQQIPRLDPGTVYTWDLSDGTCSRHQYWAPDYPSDEAGTKEDHIRNLEQALRSAVRRRTNKRLAPVAVSLSGGMDSRVLPFCASNPDDLIAFTMYDEVNREVKVAQQLASVAGVRFEKLKRWPEYYPQAAGWGVRLAGGMCCMFDFHHLGFHRDIMDWKARSLLTGCCTDFLFKAWYLSKRRREFLGRDICYRELVPENPLLQKTAPASRLSERYERLVRARLAEWFAGVPRHPSTIADYHLLEDKRLRPMHPNRDSGYRVPMWKIFPFDMVLADNDLLDCYVQLPVHWKTNATVWYQAVLRICHNARSVPNANTGIREDLGPAWVVVRDRVQRAHSRIKRLFTQPKARGLATQGSWQDWSYATSHSNMIREMWGNPITEERQLFTDLLGHDPWQRSRADWAQTDVWLFHRILTLRMWLSQRHKRRPLPIDDQLFQSGAH